MQRLLPAHGSLDPSSLYLDLEPGAEHPDRPWIALQMVASVEGVIAVDGSSGDLGGEADHQSFRRLRARADVVLVAAGTARAEDYGPVRAHDPEARAARAARGQSSRARLAVVTRSGKLDPEARLFTSNGNGNGPGASRPIVVTNTTADVDAIVDRADVLRHGEDEVDLHAALSDLRAQGVRWITAEGGPRFNASLLAAGLVDEIFLTRAPVLAGRTSGGMIDGDLDELVELDLVGLVEHDNELLLRYRVR